MRRIARLDDVSARTKVNEVVRLQPDLMTMAAKTKVGIKTMICTILVITRGN